MPSNNIILDLIKDSSVEWKALGEVCELKNGYTPSKSKKEYWENGTIPWFRLEDIRKNGRILSDAFQHVTVQAIKNKTIFPADSLIISTTATIGEVALITVPFLCNQQITAIFPNNLYRKVLDIKFVFYYLQILSNEMKKEINEGNFPIISLSKMKTFQIPIPPLELQREIVKILDKFTNLEAELEAELQLRKKQYSYYREHLLTFDDDEVEWKPLEKTVYSIKTGLNPRNFFQLNTNDATNYYVTIREIENHRIVFTEKTDKLNDEALVLCNNRSNLEVGDVLFSGTGTIGRVALITQKPTNWNIKEGVYAIKPIQNIILPKFLLYLFESEFIRNDFLSKSAGGTVKSVPMKELAKVQIPIPPLKTQQKIVAILDKFEALTNNLSKGLPAEIELRRKQYKYYRNLLLNFEREK